MTTPKSDGTLESVQEILENASKVKGPGFTMLLTNGINLTSLLTLLTPLLLPLPSGSEKLLLVYHVLAKVMADLRGAVNLAEADLLEVDTLTKAMLKLAKGP